MRPPALLGRGGETVERDPVARVRHPDPASANAGGANARAGAVAPHRLDEAPPTVRMHIGIAGPMATADVAGLLDTARESLPRGYPGAPILATLATELIRRGHRVSAFTLSSDMALDGPTEVVRGPAFSLHLVPMRPRAWPFNGHRPGRIVDLYRFERRGLERAIRTAAPDVVNAHWSYEFAWAALASGIAHVVTCHDAPALVARTSRGATRRGYRWLRAAMARHVLRRARCVTAVSPYMCRQIQGWCRVPVAMVPNPVAVPAMAERRRAGAGLRICMVGNGWGERKNPQAALRAFDLLSRVRPDARLVVCGDDFGPRGTAEQWWRARGLQGDVEFLGPIPHHAALALMADSDVLVHPALEESFGVVVAEAMAIGLPVVAGRSSGAVPWLAGDAAWLIDVTSPRAIADAVLAADADRGPATARRLAAGRESVLRRFSPAAVAAAYEAQYAVAVRGDVAAPSSHLD